MRLIKSILLTGVVLTLTASVIYARAAGLVMALVMVRPGLELLIEKLNKSMFRDMRHEQLE